MADGRSRLILVSITIAESLWLFALFSTIGLIVELGGSPLPWTVMLATIAIAIMLGRAMAMSEGDAPTLAIWQSLAGLAVIYLLLGAGSFVSGSSYDIAWLFHLTGGQFEKDAGVSAVFGFLIAAWLWRHGLKLATDRYPEDRLTKTFKIGIAVLAIAALVDEARDGGIGASALFPPFFAATLVGLAVGRLPESGAERDTGHWAKVIAVSVFGVMSVGLLLGLIGGLYGGGGVRLLYSGWGMLVDAILWLLRWPITWAVAFFEWFFSLFAGMPQDRTQRGEQQSGSEILGVDPDAAAQSSDTTVETVLNILQYPFIALVVIIAFLALAMAFRRLSKRADEDDGDERESIRGDADATDDMARLLGSLVPGWLRGRDRKRWRYPEGQGIAEVFRLYFDTIAMGIKWGMRFDPHMTPSERLPLLEAALPGAPVREVTDRFNAACYGGAPSPTDRVLELEESLRDADRQLKGR